MKKFFKIAGIGCLSLIGIFIIGGILVGIFSSSDDTKSITSTEKEIANKTIDSVQLKKYQKIKDSLVIVNQLKKVKAEKDLNSFKKNEDEFKETTFYRDPRTPNYTNVNFIYPYIGKKADYYYLRLKFQYASDDWLFIKNGIMLIDGEQYIITGNWERDNDSGIWEWLDIPVEESERIILDRLVNSESAKIRYEGQQYHGDRTITKKEKDIIKKTLEIYETLK